jgi:maltose alpha-D-glucosyltransferase/alpha-amylase
MPRKKPQPDLLANPDLDPLWYKDAVIYELHVRAFLDSSGDGVGDFRGLAHKLDYLQDLGVTAIWLLPFYPSPLKDDGYDIADYHDVHPNYGSLRDFRNFLREAHDRGLRVITELVLNHTSDQHPWFQRARRARPGDPARDFYVWSDTPDRYDGTRIIFQDFEASNWTWDRVANAYFWHRFYSHQPDLNWENPRVRRAMFSIVDYWFEMGVDALRLDAVPYLYEREATNCENLPETHQALKDLRRHVDRRFRARMLLAEANQWPEDAVAYFGAGDECHMAFHFPLMPRMFMAIRMEDRYPIIDILQQTPAIPPSCQWAVFLRNHDELTLEMVTDEERDYMYRAYAADPQARINLGIRRRLAPLLGNDRRKIELMNGLLFSMPGTPVVYYGDEIGMGDNVYLGDRNGVRTPMQWNSDRNAGFSRASSQRLYLPVITEPDSHYEAVNVETQQNNPNSLLWWMKRIIATNKRFRAFGRGSLTFLYPENRKVLAYLRQYEGETVLVVANLSRQAQYVELDLSPYKDMVPVELFGQTEFPRIGELTYLLTLTPYAFYWFALQPAPADVEARPQAPVVEAPLLTVSRSWEQVFEKGRARTALEDLLPAYLRGRRWFGGKARRIKSCSLAEAVPIAYDGLTSYLVLVEVEYTEGDPETYALALGHAEGEHALELLRDAPQVVLARLQVRGRDFGRRKEDVERPPVPGLLYEVLRDSRFAAALLDSVARRRRFRGAAGELVASSTPAFRRLRGPAAEPLPASLLRTEQSNTSLQYGERLVLKLFRRLDEGDNPDLELGRFLSQRARFPHSPPVAGHLEYRRPSRKPMTLAILQAWVPNEGDAWSYTLDTLARYYEHAVARMKDVTPPLPAQSLLELAAQETPPAAQDLIGPYLDSARLLGRRTADLHLALGGGGDDPAFAPEPFTPFYQRGIYQTMRSLAVQGLQLLRQRQRHLAAPARAEAEAVLAQEAEIHRRLRLIMERKISAMRIRIHGDYHLGQVLYTGRDFVIIDFEGEPTRAISERRIKRSPLRDVAGMLRSFHYAAYTPLLAYDAAFAAAAGPAPGRASSASAGPVRPEDIAALEPWARAWCFWVSAEFLRAYLETSQDASYLPAGEAELSLMLNAYLLEKAVYELGYELNNRPDWVRLPLKGITELLT